jgi:hypothetical protein
MALTLYYRVWIGSAPKSLRCLLAEAEGPSRQRLGKSEGHVSVNLEILVPEMV